MLVVEDEQSVAEPLAFLLRLDGYVVHWAPTGPLALSLFDATAPDLVLLDLMLPGLDGLDVCRELRSRSRVPIIMVTARDSTNDRDRGMQAGANEYVMKPYAVPQLRATIQAVMSRWWESESIADRSDADRVLDAPTPQGREPHWGRMGSVRGVLRGRRARQSGSGPAPSP